MAYNVVISAGAHFYQDLRDYINEPPPELDLDDLNENDNNINFDVEAIRNGFMELEHGDYWDPDFNWPVEFHEAKQDDPRSNGVLGTIWFLLSWAPKIILLILCLWAHVYLISGILFTFGLSIFWVLGFVDLSDTEHLLKLVRFAAIIVGFICVNLTVMSAMILPESWEDLRIEYVKNSFHRYDFWLTNHTASWLTFIS